MVWADLCEIRRLPSRCTKSEILGWLLYTVVHFRTSWICAPLLSSQSVRGNDLRIGSNFPMSWSLGCESYAILYLAICVVLCCKQLRGPRVSSAPSGSPCFQGEIWQTSSARVTTGVDAESAVLFSAANMWFQDSSWFWLEMLDVQPGCVFNLESKKPAAWATWATHPLQVGTASDGAKVALRVAVAAGETTMEETSSSCSRRSWWYFRFQGSFVKNWRNWRNCFCMFFWTSRVQELHRFFFLDDFVLLAWEVKQSFRHVYPIPKDWFAAWDTRLHDESMSVLGYVNVFEVASNYSNWSIDTHFTNAFLEHDNDHSKEERSRLLEWRIVLCLAFSRLKQSNLRLLRKTRSFFEEAGNCSSCQWSEVRSREVSLSSWYRRSRFLVELPEICCYPRLTVTPLISSLSRFAYNANFHTRPINLQQSLDSQCVCTCRLCFVYLVCQVSASLLRRENRACSESFTFAVTLVLQLLSAAEMQDESVTSKLNSYYRFF